MTFEEFLEDASPSDWGVRSELEKKKLLKVVTSIANRYGRFEYNKALEDAAEKARVKRRKVMGQYGPEYKYAVNKRSILKLKK